MKWIEDEDEQHIRHAMVMIEKFSRDNGMLPKTLATARNRLNIVLTNIKKLGQEQPSPAPRIVELSREVMRAIYPERYTHE